MSFDGECGLGPGTGNDSRLTHRHTCTHTCTPLLTEVHAHAHTQPPGGVSAVAVGFQLPDCTVESADFGISGSQAFSSLSHSLWEEPAVYGTEGGGRSCGWEASEAVGGDPAT